MPTMLADGAGVLAPRGEFVRLVEALDRLRTSPEGRAALIKAASCRVKEAYEVAAVARDLLDTVYRPLTDGNS